MCGKLARPDRMIDPYKRTLIANQSKSLRFLFASLHMQQILISLIYATFLLTISFSNFTLSECRCRLRFSSLLPFCLPFASPVSPLCLPGFRGEERWNRPFNRDSPGRKWLFVPALRGDRPRNCHAPSHFSQSNLRLKYICFVSSCSVGFAQAFLGVRRIRINSFQIPTGMGGGTKLTTKVRETTKECCSRITQTD